MKLLRWTWKLCSPLPGGKWLFSRLLGLAVPYTGSLCLHIEALGPGHCRIALKDTWRARNHLRCIHAMALANLAEAASGLALNFALPATHRSILVGWQMDYLHKARGPLTAECRVSDPQAEGEIELVSDVRDAAGALVAEGRARWLVGRRP